MLYYRATAGCGVRVFVGVSVRQAHTPRPRFSHPGSCSGHGSGVAAPAVDRLLSCTTRCTITGPIRIPCSQIQLTVNGTFRAAAEPGFVARGGAKYSSQYTRTSSTRCRLSGFRLSAYFRGLAF